LGVVKGFCVFRLFRNLKSNALILLALIVLSGCASYSHVPEKYAGPIAWIQDTAWNDTSSKGQLFYVESIDGNSIINAQRATRSASYGRGFDLTTRSESRSVRIVPMKLRIVGTHVTAAPIHEFASRAAGSFFTVQGDVSFTPEPGKSYRVTGSLTKEVASVWIADQDGKPVTEKISAN
jgi:hypothetical protein